MKNTLSRRVCTLFLPALVLLLLAPSPSKAAMSLGTSLGTGMTFDPVARTPVNVEVLPSYGASIVKFDLGVVFHLEDEVNLLLRPGVRLNLALVYLRGGFPLKVTGAFDWGFLLGIGRNLVSLGPLSIFLELDASFYHSVDFKVVPVEARLGVEIGF